MHAYIYKDDCLHYLSLCWNKIPNTQKLKGEKFIYLQCVEVSVLISWPKVVGWLGREQFMAPTRQQKLQGRGDKTLSFILYASVVFTSLIPSRTVPDQSVE